MKRDIKAFFFLSLTLMMCPSVHADEGMWMLYNLPDAVYERMQGYGFTMSKDELVDRLGDDDGADTVLIDEVADDDAIDHITQTA